MPFAVQPFISTLVGDGARPNLFDIIFPDAGGALITLRAKASAIPASTVGVASTFYFGREVKLAGNRRFDPWQVTILNDETDFAGGPRAALERWSSGLNSHVANIRLATYVPPVAYMKDATIIHYSKMGAPIATYNMVQCWPADIGGIGLDWGANDQIEEYNVTFMYQYWTSVSGT